MRCAERTSAGADLRLNERSTRAAFLTGALGPDMGYFPGGVKLFANVSHYVRTGQLARSLVTSAACQIERAFAWGWVTHVLADAAIHPLINGAAGMAAGMGRAAVLTFADDPNLHMRVEVGLDAAMYVSDRLRSDVQLVRAAYPDVADFAAQALSRTMARVFEPNMVRRSLEALGRNLDVLDRLTRVVAASQERRWPEPSDILFALLKFFPLRIISGLVARRTRLYALSHPLTPSAWMVEQTQHAIERCAVQFGAVYAGDLARLEDVNLDTGIRDAVHADYPPARETRTQLEALPRLAG